MIDITTLRAMAAAGASVEVILAAVEAEIAAESVRVQASKAKELERKQRWRDRHRDVARRSETSRDVPNGVSLSSSTSSISSTNSVIKKEGSKKERARQTQLPADWVPKPRHYEKAKKFNLPDGFVDRKADAMRSWAASKAIMRANWDATFDGFIEPKEGQANGYGGPRPLQDDRLSASKAADRLIEATKRGEFTIAPRPSLLSGESQSNLRLLPKG